MKVSPKAVFHIVSCIAVLAIYISLRGFGVHNPIALYVLSYCFGSILFGELIANLCSLGNLRMQGSGNIGATNIARVSGKKYLGAVTAALDGLKCVIPIIIARTDSNFGSDVILMTGAIAVLGHMFPVWHKFKGGKGIASFVGMSLVFDYRIGLIAAVLWLVVFLLTKVSSLASILMTLIISTGYIICYNLDECWSVLILSIIIIFKHRDNIVRLIRGEEKILKL